LRADRLTEPQTGQSQLTVHAAINVPDPVILSSDLRGSVLGIGNRTNPDAA
jgi:hypothetical protein